MTGLKGELDALYAAYNRREFVHPDPLELLYAYKSGEDQEIAGLIASCLAYGRVRQILSSAGGLLGAMAKPRSFMDHASPADITAVTRGFVHRFTTAEELAALLLGMRRAISRYGSLERLFARGLCRRDETVLPALTVFVDELRELAGNPCPSLLPSPRDGSACKRLNLFLRWMVRRDAVDPGPWALAAPSRLIVPLDTHMHRISRALGLTRRRQADMKTAREVTEGFRRLRPRDPVRYDFALTRTGIRRDGPGMLPPGSPLGQLLVPR